MDLFLFCFRSDNYEITYITRNQQQQAKRRITGSRSRMKGPVTDPPPPMVNGPSLVGRQGRARPSRPEVHGVHEDELPVLHGARVDDPGDEPAGAPAAQRLMIAAASPPSAVSIGSIAAP